MMGKKLVICSIVLLVMLLLGGLFGYLIYDNFTSSHLTSSTVGMYLFDKLKLFHSKSSRLLLISYFYCADNSTNLNSRLSEEMQEENKKAVLYPLCLGYKFNWTIIFKGGIDSRCCEERIKEWCFVGRHPNSTYLKVCLLQQCVNVVQLQP